MAKRKYEVTHVIRIERRKTLRVGAVVELDAGRAHEWRHALRALPEDAQVAEEQAPQEPEAPAGAATEDGAEAEELEAGTETSPAVEAAESEPSETTETHVASDETVAYQGEPRITDAARAEAERLGIDLAHVRAGGAHNTLTITDVRREARRVKAEREAEQSS